MKYNFRIGLLDESEALKMIRQYHYSNTLPKLNKYFVGFFLENKLVGVITLGYGTQPLHTIKKLFPSLETKDYYEIGRMCMTEEMPKNSESQMISALIKWLKIKEPTKKVLFTWADGMLGKVGYVYQSCSFYYAGYSNTDIYIYEDGTKINPRQMTKILKKDGDKRIGIRPTVQQMKEYKFSHYMGKQFKYLTFLCSKVEKKKLIKECTYKLNFDYPKENDLLWKKKNLETLIWEKSNKPNYKTDIRFVKNKQMTIDDFI